MAVSPAHESLLAVRQELAVEDYDAAGRIQRATSYSYDFPIDPVTTRELHGLSVQSWPFGSQQVFTWGAFAVVSGWKYPNRETRTVYDTTGMASFSSTILYAYGNPSHAQLTEKIETNSDNVTQRITRWKYPGDYAIGTGNPEAAALSAMRGGAHIVNAVIERSTSVRVGALERVVEAEITTYKEFLPGQFLPHRRYILNSPSPIP